ncbi:MAG: hypothetical protein U5P41_15015 [Gammaproteobacteria bacterium]|nr:hypothetical protein [Gammaproteobacteria bacterium]
MVDFKIVSPQTEVNPTTGNIVNGTVGTPQAGTGVYDAKYYINWEDSEQGGDFDQDMWGILTYRLDTTVNPATLEIATDAIAESTVNGQLFGFITNGTTEDGFHAYSGIESANYE